MIYRRLKSTFAVLFVGASTLALAGYPSPDDWRDEVIYQVLTDRWDDGNPANNNADGTYSPATGNRTHGGDFQGLKRRLTYLRSLGVTSIWISPIPSNGAGEYHGYAADDFTTTADQFGTIPELQDFVNTAHGEGFRVVLDVVTNHGGNLFQDYGYTAPPSTVPLNYRNASRQHQPPFNSTSYFHAHGSVGNWSDPEQILGEIFGLDDLKTELPYVRTQMADIYGDWIQNVDFDAFRVDTVKHVEMGFWQEWCPAIRSRAAAVGKDKFFLIGEVYDGSDQFNGKYTGTKSGGAPALDTTLDYPLYYQTNGVFATKSWGAQSIINHYNAIPWDYDSYAQTRLVTFLDNHDQPRFLYNSLADDNAARLELALTFQMTSLGIPCIYYGTEQRFNGGHDPACREDMFDGQYEWGPSLGNNFDQTAPTYRLVRKLAQLRRQFAPLRRGSLLPREVSNSPDIFAYSRIFNGQEVLVALNTADSSRTSQAWQTTWTNGTVVKDLLDPAFTATVNGAGQIPAGLQLAGDAFRILVPQASVLPLEPEVISTSLPMEGTLANLSATLQLTFSQAMNPAAVANALSFTNPSTSATFAWSAGNTVLTLSPVGGSWPEQTAQSLLMGDSATDSNGLPLTGGFELQFKTAASPDSGTIDGTISNDPRWTNVTALATQTVKTGFGDNNNSAPDNNSGGSELNQMYVMDTSSDVVLAVTGALERNGNALSLFFDTDSGAGGAATLPAGTSPFLSGSPSATGTTLPSGMKANLMLQVQLSTPGQTLTLRGYRWDAAGQLVEEKVLGTVPGSSSAPTIGQVAANLDGTEYPIRIAYNNSHTGPVSGGSAAPWAANPNGAGAATGLEVRIPKSLLGAGPYRILAGISGSTGFWSNQFLPPISAAGNLGWTPNLGNAGANYATYTASVIPVEFSRFTVE